jgi:hypothetical protein
VGNIGSRRRQQYTAIGDPVNTAARLDALNKELGTHLLISESTYYHIQGLFEARPLGPQQLKGRDEPIGVFEVQGRRRGPDTPLALPEPQQPPRPGQVAASGSDTPRGLLSPEPRDRHRPEGE